MNLIMSAPHYKGIEDTVFNNRKIPPGMWIWCETPVVVAGRKPVYLSVTVSGYRKQ